MTRVKSVTPTYLALSTRYETIMDSYAQSTSGLSSLLADASRTIRSSKKGGDSHATTLRSIAAGVAGPVLWAYVAWVLRTAQAADLRRVLFTARDGQVMLRMAKKIAPKLNIHLTLEYFYGGRQIVHLAGLKQVDERALAWITGSAGAVTAKALLERVGLAQSDVLEALQTFGLPTTGNIGWERCDRVEAFFRDPRIQSLILTAAEQRRAEIYAYFKHCGLVAGDPCAVVDIGWRGSVLRSMFDVIGPESAAKHSFLYFGLYARPADVPEAKMSAFCFDVSGSQPIGAAFGVPSLMAVMEIFCQADHPQVLHVANQGGRFVPLMRPDVAGSAATFWDIVFFQDCMEAFAEAVAIDSAADLSGNLDAALRSMCNDLLQCLMCAPTRDEATVLGSIQYVDDQGGTTSQPFAVPFGIRDARAALRSGKLPQKTFTFWEKGAWKLTPEVVRPVLQMACWLGRHRR